VRARMQMTLEQVHRGVVDGGERGGVVYRSSFVMCGRIGVVGFDVGLEIGFAFAFGVGFGVGFAILRLGRRGSGVGPVSVAMRTSYAHLSDLNGFSFPLGGCFDVVFGGGEHLDAVAANEAMEGGEPIFVVGEGEGYGFGEGGEGSARGEEEGRRWGELGAAEVVFGFGVGGWFHGRWDSGSGWSIEIVGHSAHTGRGIAISRQLRFEEGIVCWIHPHGSGSIEVIRPPIGCDKTRIRIRLHLGRGGHTL